MSAPDWAGVLTALDGLVARLERLLPGPIERVWAYVTESDKRATWLAGGEMELRVGGKVHAVVFAAGTGNPVAWIADGLQRLRRSCPPAVVGDEPSPGRLPSFGR